MRKFISRAFLLLVACIGSMAGLWMGNEYAIQAQEELPGCFSDWQLIGQVEKYDLGRCQVVIGFPIPSGAGSNQELTFRLKLDPFDSNRHIRMIICRSETGVTPSNGFEIASDELGRSLRYGNKKVSQLGTVSSAGADCLIHTPESANTVWKITPVGHPDQLLSITLNGVPLVQEASSDSCFTNWQTNGETEAFGLDDCHITLGFPPPPTAGMNSTASQAKVFRINYQRFDPARHLWLQICRSQTGITTDVGLDITSTELDENFVLGNRQAIQLGTVAAGGKDCFVHRPQSTDTNWLLQPVNHPDELYFVSINGVPLTPQ